MKGSVLDSNGNERMKKLITERELYERGTIQIKFWLHISPEEQLKRFNKRLENPEKTGKLLRRTGEIGKMDSIRNRRERHAEIHKYRLLSMDNHTGQR